MALPCLCGCRERGLLFGATLPIRVVLLLFAYHAIRSCLRERTRRASDSIGGPGNARAAALVLAGGVRRRSGQGHAHGPGVASFPVRSAAPAHGARFRSVL